MADDPAWTTAIADVRDDDIVIRGHRVTELIGETSFVSMIFLLLRGDLPEARESRMLDAVLVSVIDHGISPSSMVARILAASGTPLQASIAGGMLSIADWHGGSGEQLARILAELATRLEQDGSGDTSGCDELVRTSRDEGVPIPGFGHPQHPNGDPRATRLLALAQDLGVRQRHCRLLEVLGDRLAHHTGRPSLGTPNITGAISAILLDLGFPWQSFRGFVIASRSFGLTAHVVEELTQGNRWRHAPASSVRYTGPDPDGQA